MSFKSTIHRLRFLALSASLLGTSACGLGGLGDLFDRGPRSPVDFQRVGTGEHRLTLEVGTDAETGEPVCAADLVEDTFRYGLCVCGDLGLAGDLETRTLQAPGEDAPVIAAGVGVNGDYELAGRGDIEGPLTVGGTFSPVGDQVVAGELHVGGQTSVVGDAVVEHDAYLAGDIDSIGLNIAGTLYSTDDEDYAGWEVSYAERVTQAFTVDAPCGCEDAPDVQSFIDEAREDNDNEAAGLAADAWTSLVGDHEATLSSGRYYVEGIELAGDLRIAIDGPVALYVGGDVEMAGEIDIALESDDAELNLFVGGDIGAAGELVIGSDADPERVRLYVAGDGEIGLAGGLALYGALYAPRAVLSSAGDVEIAGAAVVRDVQTAGSLRVAFDAMLLDTHSSCEAPADEPADEPAEEPDDEPISETAEPSEPAPADEPSEEPEEPEEPSTDEHGCPEEEPTSCETSLDCDAPNVCLDGICAPLPM
jgi:hypothetical protein